jgi:hypothetical protein
VPRHIQLAIRNDEELSKLLVKGACFFAALPRALPALHAHALHTR